MRPSFLHSTPPSFVLGAVLALSAARAGAEVSLPRESPAARVFQQVGLTEIEVEYGSPAVKGRRLWGGAVPYGAPWPISPSPGLPVTIRFSKDVAVAGKALAAGKYRLYAVPGKAEWTVVFSKNLDAPVETRDERSDPDAVRVKLRPKAAPARERLAFLFAAFNDDAATLDLEWEKLRLSIPIATNTTRDVQASIAELDDGARSYANAARYMLETKKDFDAGLRYADRSLALKDDWYTHWIKAALLAAKHDYKAAVVEGQRARELGEALGDGFTLRRDLDRALAEWTKKN